MLIGPIEIKNPIHLARMILELSTKPLTLRRVPPNLLVGQGATDFAWEHGIPVVPHDLIVSRNARDRFLRWREDLRRADGRMTPSTSSQAGDEEQLDPEYEERAREKLRRDHTQALLNSTWNEGQPDSPAPRSPGREILGHGISALRHSPVSSPPVVTRTNASGRSSIHDMTSSSSPSPKRARHNPPPGLPGPNTLLRSVSSTDTSVPPRHAAQHRGVSDNDGAMSPISPTVEPAQVLNEQTCASPSSHVTRDDDMITDTVGAIAIDMYGHIAAASSSGGIGMKHRGRVGPAALVGIGSAVVPVDVHDPDAITVAAVTSGTGEHMATTMASQKCAERLYHNNMRGRGGKDIDATEEEALVSFIQTDFMGHAGVKDSISAGAIGVMAVKRTPWGYFLYFAHNTDSFALSSMHSNEREPKCVMSRIGEQGGTVQGGRKIRIT